MAALIKIERATKESGKGVLPPVECSKCKSQDIRFFEDIPSGSVTRDSHYDFCDRCKCVVCSDCSHTYSNTFDPQPISVCEECAAADAPAASYVFRTSPTSFIAKTHNTFRKNGPCDIGATRKQVKEATFIYVADEVRRGSSVFLGDANDTMAVKDILTAQFNLSAERAREKQIRKFFSN